MTSDSVPVAPAVDETPEISTCRNCGAQTGGAAYCPNCGQETTVELPTARVFLREAAGRYVALDGRLWRTLSRLFFHPGFLTREYVAGRRRRYVRPGRLFLVLSLALFAVLRFVSHPPAVDFREGDRNATSEAREADVAKDDVSPGKELGKSIERAPKEGLKGDDAGFTLGDSLNARVKAFDDKWGTSIATRADAFNRLPRQEKSEQLYNGLLRYGPYAMFALLPLFAFLLKLVYLGRSRRYPLRPRRYAAHLVYGAHNHAFTFLAVIAMVASPWGLLRAALVLWVIAYWLWSMKVVYGGRWIGVVARALVVFWVYVWFFGLALLGLVIAAALLR
jgi:hypothetical protein